MNLCYLLPAEWANDKTYLFELNEEKYCYYNLAEYPHANSSALTNAQTQITRHEGIVIVTSQLPAPDELLQMITGTSAPVEEANAPASPAVEQPTEPLEVLIQTWNGVDKDKAIEIIREVFDGLIADDDFVFFDVPNHSQSNPCRPGRWCVKVWSTPLARNAQTTNVKIIDGIRCLVTESGMYEYVSTDNSKPIVINGTVVGQVVNNTIYIHFHVLKYRETYGLFKKILLEGIEVFNGKEYDMTDIFVAQLIEMSSSRIVRAKVELEEVMRQIEDYAGTLLTKTRKRAELIETIGSHDEKKMGNYLLSEMELLNSNVNILSVEVDANGLVLHTDTMYFTVENQKYEVGKFKITLNIENAQVRFFNQTRRISGGYDNNMHAPHVFPDGKPCLGNIEESVAQLIANLELALLGDLLCNYLSSVNIGDSAGKYYHLWPKVTE